LRIEPFTLFAFGFGNLAMLGWLAAAAAPLLIHLWSRHRFREAPWAAMQFLLAAMRKNARRLQLQQWLLLAVRTLIILLIVLAVAEPYGERLLAGGTSGPAHKIIVIDGSYSMAYRENGTTNFRRAKQLAIDLVQASHPADAFTVILMSSNRRMVVRDPTFDHAGVATQIESLSQPQAGAKLPETIALIREAIADRAKQNMPPRREVYFFTDLQARTWEGLVKPTQTPDTDKQPSIAAEVASLGEQAALVVVDLGHVDASNLAIESASTTSAVVTTSRETGVSAVLHNFSREASSKVRVELLVDDAATSEQTLDIAAGGEAAIHFTHRFSTAGEHTVTVRATGDRLELDNSRSLVVPVRDEIRVLCVAGREGAAKYLVSALNPNPSGDSPIRPIIVADGELADTPLADFDCVFLCNVAQLTANEATRLTRYVESGGGLVIFLGNQTMPASYNGLSEASKGSQQTLLPATIGDVVSQPQFGLDPLNYRHPIVAPFRGRERAGLLTTPISRHFKLEIAKGRPGVEVAAALPSGDPLIVAAPFGRGRTVLVGTDGSLSSVDPASGEPWTTWPTWPSYLPIVHELLAFASGGQQTLWQRLVGAPLTGSLSNETAASIGSGGLHIARPDGRTEPVSLQSTPAGKEWRYTNTDISGIYTLRGLPKGQTQRFAVNVDTAEGDLAKINPQQLPPAIKVRSTWQGETGVATTQTTAQAGLTTSLLWGALALLFAESFMAWQFGRGTL
jgi:hypothetical protein